MVNLAMARRGTSLWCLIALVAGAGGWLATGEWETGWKIASTGVMLAFNLLGLGVYIGAFDERKQTAESEPNP